MCPVGRLEEVLKITRQEVVRDEPEPGEPGTESGCEAEILIYGPKNGRKLIDQDVEASVRCAQPIVRVLSLDGECDLAANGVQELEITVRISIWGRVILEHQNAERLRTSLQRNPQP